MVARPKDSAANNWGQAKRYGPAWAEGTPLTVLQLRETGIWPPEVMNLTLAFEIVLQPPPGPLSDCTWSWRVLAGVGGAARSWLVDARAAQQLSLSLENVQVDLVARRRWLDRPFVSPAVVAAVSAFVARGNTSTERASYTESVAQLAPAGEQSFSVPPGASSWRISGPTTGPTSPFVATNFVIVAALNSSMQSWQASALLAPMAAGDWIPLIAGADRLILSNGAAGNVSANIEWGLDL